MSTVETGPGEAAAGVQVRVLGNIEVDGDDGRPVAIAGAKQTALLAALAAEVGHVVAAERLIDLLWPGAAPSDPDNALHHQVSRLRKALGDPERLASRGAGYVLDLPADAVDAARFTALAAAGRDQLRAGRVAEAIATLVEADGLWQGATAYAGIDDDWARAEATRLELLRLDVVEDRIGAQLDQGHHHDLLAELEDLVTAHPYREPFWGHLMLALYRCQRQTDALAAFRRAREALADAHGLDPGPALQALETAILTHDPALSLPPSEPTPTTTPNPTPTARERRPWGHVPVPLTSFVGREGQLSEVVDLVGAHRLVTLTGPGGAGKTRLAVEAATHFQGTEGFPDGAWAVELAPLTDDADVAQAVAAVLSAGEPGRLQLLAATGERVVDFLRSRQILLVLDNCEHLFPGVSEWTDSVLAAAPGVHVLATSREPLGIVGEVQWPVPPLAGTEAVTLFEDRARLVGPFRLTDETVPAVGEICRHLDGLPLAIELAAARTKALPVDHIATQLGDRFRLLVSTSRTAPLRQRTLRAALDWSYDLLDQAERDVLGLVSVFDGGCSLDSVEALAGDAGDADVIDVIDVLTGLVDKSLVVAQPTAPTGPRYDLLETIRAYGREQLDQAGRLDDVRRAHRAHVVAFVEQAEDGLLASDHRAWRRRLEVERDNIRAAYDHAMDTGAWADTLRLTSSLWWFWSVSNGRAEGRAWLAAAIDAARAGPDADDHEVDPHVDAALRVKALMTFCYLAGQEGDVDPAIVAGERALVLSEQLDDPWIVAWTKQSLALTLQLAGRSDGVDTMLAEARAVMAERGDHWRVAGNDLVRGVRGVLAGDLDEVDAASRAALRQSELAGYDQFVGRSHLLRAWVADQRGDLDDARAAYEQALTSARHQEIDQDTAFALTQLGRVASAAGDMALAEAALDEALALAEAAEADWFAALARAHQVALLRQRGDDAGAAALVEAVTEWADSADAADGPAAFYLILGGDPRSFLA